MAGRSTELLRLRMRYGWPYVPVRWAGSDASGDTVTWEPLGNLTNCEEAIAAFERATGRSFPGRRRRRLSLRKVSPWTPGDLGAPLVERTVLYWWPDDGWQRGTVARPCPRGAFSHAVAYTRQTSALRGTADTLLDAARWVLLSRAPAAGVGGSSQLMGSAPVGPWARPGRVTEIRSSSILCDLWIYSPCDGATF